MGTPVRRGCFFFKGTLFGVVVLNETRRNHHHFGGGGSSFLVGLVAGLPSGSVIWGHFSPKRTPVLLR